MTTRRIPAPQAQAFVACRKIANDPQTGEIVIIGPVSRWRAVLSGREPSAVVGMANRGAEMPGEAGVGRALGVGKYLFRDHARRIRAAHGTGCGHTNRRSRSNPRRIRVRAIQGRHCQGP